MEINQISRTNVIATDVAFVPCPETYFNITQQFTERGFTLEIEGRINAQGGGGGRFQFVGPAGAQIQGHADIDNGAPVFFSGFSTPVGGAIANGNHKFKVFAVVEAGVNTGLIQLQIALNTAQGSLTLGRTMIRAMAESANFE